VEPELQRKREARDALSVDRPLNQFVRRVTEREFTIEVLLPADTVRIKARRVRIEPVAVHIDDDELDRSLVVGHAEASRCDNRHEARFLLRVEGDIEVVVLTSLQTYEGVDAPTTTDPEPDPRPSEKPYHLENGCGVHVRA